MESINQPADFKRDLDFLTSEAILSYGEGEIQTSINFIIKIL